MTRNSIVNVLLALLIVSSAVGTVYAATNTIDDYSDGDISEYTGDTGAFNVQTSTTHPDGNGFAVKGTAGTTLHQVYATGDAYTVSQGDKIRYTINLGSGASEWAGLAFAAQSSNPSGNQYRVMFTKSNAVEFTKFSGGTSTVLNSTSFAQSGETWYTVTIDWEETGEMQVYINDTAGNVLGSMTVTDTMYASGGIGYTVYEGGESGGEIIVGSVGTVVEDTQPSVESVSASSKEVLARWNVSLSAEVTAPDGIQSVNWDMDSDGTTDVTGQDVTYQFNQFGTHNISVTVRILMGTRTRNI